MAHLIKYLILMMILLSGAVALPTAVCAMIIDPPAPPAEDSPSCGALQAWLDENQDTGGTYVLDGDLVITDYLSIYMPEAPIAIEAGPYHIYVRDTALLELVGGNIAITGDGGAEGLIRTSSMGTLIFAECSITAENGTALFYEGGEPTSWSIDIGGTLNAPTHIQACGENARGIVCEQPDLLRLSNTFVNTDGAYGIGIFTVSDISMTNCTVTAAGSGAASVISQNGRATGTLCRFTPEPPEFSCDDTRWSITDPVKLNFVLPPFTPYEASGLPDYVTVNIANREAPEYTCYIALAVSWDRAAYVAGLERNEPFTLTGTLEQREDILTHAAQSPTAAISFETASPIGDLSVAVTPDVKMCRLAFSFTPPAGASSVKLQKSMDKGISWNSEDITQAYSQNEAGKAVYEDILKDPGTALYRLKVMGSSYAGYSNTVTCIFEALPLTGTEHEDIDGSRGGGGRNATRRDPDGNIFENLLEYIPFKASVGSVDENSAPESDKNTNSTLQQKMSSSEGDTASLSEGQVNSTTKAPLRITWAALGLLLILLFFIAAVLWLNPALRSRFFRK